MNDRGPAMEHRGLAIEWVGAAAVIIALAYALWILHSVGFLPQPFFSDPGDTLMDGINPAYWTNNLGAYDVYQSVYPPLSYALLRLVTIHSCYLADAVNGRDCDWLFPTFLISIYFLTGIIVARSYWLTDRRTVLPRTIAMMIGLPMAYAMERGNLIIPCFAVFALGCGPVLRSARLRWIATAFAVNFKPYLIAPVFTYALRGRWRALEGCLIAVVLVYAGTWIAYGSGSPLVVYNNIVSFSGDPGRAASWPYIFYSTSYSALLQFVDSGFPLMNLTGSKVMDLADIALPLLIHGAQLVILCAFLATWIEPKAVEMRRLYGLGVLFVLVTTDPGGYSQMCALYLVFFEPWRGAARITALICAYILSVPADWQIGPLGPVRVDSWLANGPVMTDYGITIGPLIRPGLIIICACAIASTIIGDVIRYRRTKRAEIGALAPAY